MLRSRPASDPPITAPGRRQWRAVALRTALALAAFVASLMVADRIVGALCRTRDRHALRLAPDASWRHRSDEFDYEFRTNSLGFRGPDVSVERGSSQTRRVVVLGDSFVAGHGVAEDSLFTTLWQGRLDAAHGPGAVEVINLGRTGTSTLMERRIYERVGRPLRADVVVLCVYLGNDLAEVVEERTSEEDAAWAPAGLARRAAYGLAPHLYLELAMRRQAVETSRQAGIRSEDALLADVRAAARGRGTDESAAAERFRALPEAVRTSAAAGGFPLHRLVEACADPKRTKRSLDPDDTFFDAAWPRMAQSLEEIRRMVADDGATFHLVVIPSALQVSPQAQAYDRSLGIVVREEWLTTPVRTQRALHDWAQQRSVPLIDLTEALRAQSADVEPYFRQDGHFHKTGHAIAAAALNEEIRVATVVRTPTSERHRTGRMEASGPPCRILAGHSSALLASRFTGSRFRRCFGATQ